MVNFSELKLKPELTSRLVAGGFSDMFLVQEQALPLALSGHDVVGHARTGSGKTLIFAITILQRIHEGRAGVQALVVVPTRELALQVTTEIRKLAPRGAKVAAVYGGASIERQVAELRHGSQVVVGTPGRLLDLMKRQELSLSHVSILVLDEADRMFDMGFVKDIELIISHTPSERQTLLFSATIPSSIKSLIHRHTRNAQFVSVVTGEMTVKAAKQYYVDVVHPLNRLPALCKLLEAAEKTLVFCRTKFGARRLYRSLEHKGFASGELHGNLAQNKRSRIIDDFKAGRVKVLVATDVAARGLDIEGVTHVVNYDIPNDPNTYVHRVGRTARAGKAGQAITLITGHDHEQLRKILRATGAEISALEMELPPVQHQETRPHHGSYPRPRYYHNL